MERGEGAERVEGAELHLLRECHQDGAQVQRQQPLRATTTHRTLARAATRAATRRGRAHVFEAGRANQLLR